MCELKKSPQTNDHARKAREKRQGLSAGRDWLPVFLASVCQATREPVSPMDQQRCLRWTQPTPLPSSLLLMSGLSHPACRCHRPRGNLSRGVGALLPQAFGLFSQSSQFHPLCSSRAMPTWRCLRCHHHPHEAHQADAVTTPMGDSHNEHSGLTGTCISPPHQLPLGTFGAESAHDL